MAGGKLSFAVAINLLTDNFKRGANTVKNQFNAMKFQALSFIAALGVGSIGLSNFVSRLVSVTRETNRANTALKNVSGTMGKFAADKKFLLELANKYGIEINTLTESYAKFSAAAKVSGMSTEDQRKVFDSVSRSCTAFGMSASDSNGVMLALSQMMGKGKISSEELRKQMGERLPVALQAMATAAGVSVAGLEKLMSQGKLLSKDILPKFADALNEMIPTVDTDNLETSLSRLSNTFTELVNQSGFQDRYKALIDWFTEALKTVSKNIQNLFIAGIAVISFAVTIFFAKVLKGWWYIANSIPPEQQKLNAALLRATAERVTAEKDLETARLNHSVAVGKSKIRLAEQVAMKEKLFALSIIAEDKARLAVEAANASRRASVVTKSLNTIKFGAAKMIASLRNMWAAFSPAIIISAITLFIGKLVQIHRETTRIKNIFSEYQNEANKAVHSNEIIQLEKLRDIATDLNKGLDERKTALSAINSQLETNYKIDGKTFEINGDINSKIADRIRLLKAQAEAQYYTQKLLDTQDKIEDNRNKQETLKLKIAGGNSNGFNVLWQSILKATGNNDELSLLEKEEGQLRKTIHDAETKIEKAIANGGIAGGTVNNSFPLIDLDNGKDKKNTKSDLQRAEENYINKLEELNNKLANNAIKQHEYNKAIDELNKEIYEKIAGLLTPEETKENETFKKAKSGVDSPLESKSVSIEREYQKELNKLSNQKRNQVLTGEEFVEKQNSLINSTLALIGSLDDIDEGGQKFIEALRMAENKFKKEFVLPEFETRNTTFDYKKTDREKTSEEQKVAEKNLDNLKGLISGDSDQLLSDIKKADGKLEELKTKYKDETVELIDQLNFAIGKVDSLEHALKIAEVKEDIKSLNKELNRGIYSGVKDIASSADRLGSSFTNLKDVINDADASQWEKILAIFNALTQTIDGILSVVDMITRLTEITEKLTLAKQAQAVIENANTVNEVTNLTTLTTAKTVSDSAIATSNSAKSATIVAGNEAEKTSAMGVMAAQSAAAYAAIPFVGVGLAAAQMAEMSALVATFSSIPKFANGGIVSGRTLAEVGEYPGASSNPEVIAPLSKLKQLIKPDKTESSAVSGDVCFRIEGNALVGVLNNYTNRMKKLK